MFLLAVLWAVLLSGPSPSDATTRLSSVLIRLAGATKAFNWVGPGREQPHHHPPRPPMMPPYVFNHRPGYTVQMVENLKASPDMAPSSFYLVKPSMVTYSQLDSDSSSNGTQLATGSGFIPIVGNPTPPKFGNSTIEGVGKATNGTSLTTVEPVTTEAAPTGKPKKTPRPKKVKTPKPKNKKVKPKPKPKATKKPKKPKKPKAPKTPRPKPAKKNKNKKDKESDSDSETSETEDHEVEYEERQHQPGPYRPFSVDPPYSGGSGPDEFGFFGPGGFPGMQTHLGSHNIPNFALPGSDQQYQPDIITLDSLPGYPGSGSGQFHDGSQGGRMPAGFAFAGQDDMILPPGFATLPGLQGKGSYASGQSGGVQQPESSYYYIQHPYTNNGQGSGYGSGGQSSGESNESGSQEGDGKQVDQADEGSNVYSSVSDGSQPQRGDVPSQYNDGMTDIEDRQKYQTYSSSSQQESIVMHPQRQQQHYDHTGQRSAQRDMYQIPYDQSHINYQPQQGQYQSQEGGGPGGPGQSYSFTHQGPMNPQKSETQRLPIEDDDYDEDEDDEEIEDDDDKRKRK